jgi:predicted glycoside hydrolase/deacetylase ChbG (UPF0249 family)
MRRLEVCADDFGLSSTLSASLDALAERGRLSSISCLVNGPHWRAPRVPDRVGVGLHFNLSEGEPLSTALRRVWPRLPALPRLIAAAHLGRLPIEAIAAEWRAQLDAFVQAVGRAPDHVDGHQHVHQLPGVREIVLGGVAALAPRPAVRNTGRVIGPGFAAKRVLIEATGGRALRRELARRGLRSNAVLLGCYDFAARDYGALMRGWLRRVPQDDAALLFCHPGPAEPGDAIGAARAREHAYFASDAFTTDLAHAGVEIAFRRAG